MYQYECRFVGNRGWSKIWAQEELVAASVFAANTAFAVSGDRPAVEVRGKGGGVIQVHVQIDFKTTVISSPSSTTVSCTGAHFRQEFGKKPRRPRG